MLLKLVLKGLVTGREYSAYFILSFALGLLGLQLLFATQNSIRDQLNQKAQELMGGDLSVSVRREFNGEERAQIKKLTSSYPTSQAISLFTMVAGKTSSRLTSIKAVDKNYPLYGALSMAKGSYAIAASPSQEPLLYADDQLLNQLGLSIGDKVKIGALDFLIKDRIIDDPSQSLRFSALAPKAYMSLDDLRKTDLLGFGSTVTEAYLIQIPEAQELKKLNLALDHALTDSSINLKTANQSAQDSIRTLRYLADYLGLISLVGFLLSVIGAGFLFSRYLQEQLKTMAIMNTLGLQKWQSLLLLGAQALILSLLSAGVAALLSYPIQKILSNLISRVLPNAVNIEMSLGIFAFTFGLALLGSLLIIAPYLFRVWNLQPKALLETGDQLPPSSRFAPLVLISLVSVASIWAVGFYISQSLRVSSYFTLSILAIGLVIGGLGQGLLKSLKLVPTEMWRRVAVWDLNGKIFSQALLIVVLSLSVLLIDSVNQIETSIRSQIRTGETKNTPAYFLFDVQDEQIQKLKDVVKDLDLQLLQPSPMVRAKLMSINQKPFERDLEGDRFSTREEEEENRFRNRGLNLSYRSQLEEGESLVSGQPLREKYAGEGPVELSVEEDYAKRIGIGLNDTLEFNVQGMDVVGVVKNLRKVNWNRFLPNFFVIVEPGFLEDAPKTWLAGLAKDSPNKLLAAQRAFADQFPNISFVDLEQVIQKMQEITGQMSMALQFTALLVLIAGIFILFAIGRYHLHRSQRDLNLLKVLGATPRFITGKIAFEYGVLILICSLLGFLGSFVLSKLILRRVFDTPFHWNPRASLILFLGLVVIGVTMSFLANRWAKRTQPRDLL